MSVLFMCFPCLECVVKMCAFYVARGIIKQERILMENRISSVREICLLKRFHYKLFRPFSNLRWQMLI